MADNKTLNALVIELDGPISSIKELKQQIETLSVSLAKAGEDSAGYAQGVELLEKRQSELAKATSLMKGQNTAAKDSYYALNKALSETRKAYKNLSEEERNNKEVGGQMLLQIKELDLELKGLDAEMGQFQRNVGDYSQSINKMSDKLHQASDSFKAMAAGGTTVGKVMDMVDKTAKVLAKNKLMAILIILVPLITKISDKLKENNKVMESTTKIVASMSPIMDLLNVVIDKLATAFAKLAEKVANLLTKILPKKKDAVPEAMEEVATTTDKATTSINKQKEAVDELAESLKKLREEISEDMAIRAEDEAFQKQADADFMAREKEREAADKARLERQEKEMAIRKKMREEDEKNEEALENQRRTREELAAKRKKQAQQEYVDLVAGLMGSLADIYEANGEADARYAKKAKALRIASASIQTINGAISAYMNTIDTYKNPAIAIPLGIANAATVTAAGLANIAKMKSTDVSGTGTAVATPAATTSAAVTPNVPQVAIATSASQQAAINQPVKAYIVADDLEGARLKAQQTEQETSF